MDNEHLEKECRLLAAFSEDEKDERYAILRDGIVDQIRVENGYPSDEATRIVESTIRRLRGEQPERLATLELRNGEHRLRSGGILIIKEGHLHELHAPLPHNMSSDHEARQRTVAKANKLAGLDFYAMSLWKRTNNSWMASWFRSGKGP